MHPFTKQIRKQFVEFWGSTPHSRDLYIKFYYNENEWVEIKLDKKEHRYITPSFSPTILESIKQSFNRLKQSNYFSESPTLFKSSSNLLSDRDRYKAVTTLKEEMNQLFSFKKELLFIPAGRSLLSTLSDQLQYIHPHQLDYPMRKFIERINASKSFFNKSIDEIIREKQALETSSIRFSPLRKSEGLIRKILKGEYIHDKDGGKLYVNKNTYTKINFASSGQQESIWILLSLFLVILEKVEVTIFVEEPEAHLFPIAQKDMVQLICFIANTMKAQFVITTHSPYILSALNNHVYASVLGEKASEKVSAIISKNEWLAPSKISAFHVESGTTESLFDEELNMLQTEKIDSVSEKVNEEYDQLFEVENEAQHG